MNWIIVSVKLNSIAWIYITVCEQQAIGSIAYCMISTKVMILAIAY